MESYLIQVSEFHYLLWKYFVSVFMKNEISNSERSYFVHTNLI